MTTKTELISELAEFTGSTKKEIALIINAFTHSLYFDLNEKGEASIPGLGKLKLKQRKERQGRNPRTGESLIIPARKVVKFSPTRQLKTFISESID